MGGLQVEVRSKVPGLGRLDVNRDGLPDVLVELASEHTTVGELISRAVAEQIRLISVDAARCRAAFDRQYLSAQEIRAQAATGVVQFSRQTPQPVPDLAKQVALAHRAFQRNVFVVLVGGRQVNRLDEELVIGLDESVVFLRLTPLVGG